MQRNIVETVMGAVVLLVAAGFLIFFYRMTDIHPTSGYEITANFSKVDGLQEGSPVMVSGVKVGQVIDFTLDRATYQAVVRMNIASDVKLPTDTAAVISSGGLLDGKFMSLEPGAEEEFLEPGGRIEFTQASPSLEQMLGQVIFSLTKDDKKSGSAEAEADAPAPATAAEEPAAETPAAEPATP